jgi:hypothetical protein
MKNIILITGFVLAFAHICAREGFCRDYSWEKIGREITPVYSLLVEPSDPGRIYLGSNNDVYRSKDAGRSWERSLSVKGDNGRINLLISDPENASRIYAATGNGLFASENHGESWKRLYRGRNSRENDCLSVTVDQECLYLGTRGGLFISRNQGRDWSRVKADPGESCILAGVIKKGIHPAVVVASANCLFFSFDRGKSWQKSIFSFDRDDTPDDDSQEDADRDQDNREVSIKGLALCPGISERVFLSSTKGIYSSIDSGANWEPFSTSGLLSRKVNFLFFSGDFNFYCLGDSGLYRFTGNSWQELSVDVTAQAYNFAALDNAGNLLLATDNGLFRSAFERVKAGGVSPLSFYLEGEPGIMAVQQAVMRYAEVNPEKIKRWRKLAATRAFLPELSTGISRDTADLWHWESGSSTKIFDDALIKGRDALDWYVTLKWDLAEIIWSSEQTSIDVRSRLDVQLRQDLLDEATKLYFERIRLRMEIDGFSIEDRKRRGEKELKLQEVTAGLDALTGGYFLLEK